MKDRIRQIRKEVKLTQTEFGNRIGVKGNTIGNYELGLRNPTDAVIVSICREFNINEEWLRTGNGEMMSPVSKDEEISKLLGEAIRTNESDFRRRLISALARLDDKGWNELEKLIDLISENK